jgi:hypothetical protein
VIKPLKRERRKDLRQFVSNEHLTNTHKGFIHEPKSTQWYFFGEWLLYGEYLSRTSEGNNVDMWHKALAFEDCLAVMVLCCSSVSKSVNERLKGCVSLRILWLFCWMRICSFLQGDADLRGSNSSSITSYNTSVCSHICLVINSGLEICCPNAAKSLKYAITTT